MEWPNQLRWKQNSPGHLRRFPPSRSRRSICLQEARAASSTSRHALILLPWPQSALQLADPFRISLRTWIRGLGACSPPVIEPFGFRLAEWSSRKRTSSRVRAASLPTGASLPPLLIIASSYATRCRSRYRLPSSLPMSGATSCSLAAFPWPWGWILSPTGALGSSVSGESGFFFPFLNKTRALTSVCEFNGPSALLVFGKFLIDRSPMILEWISYSVAVSQLVSTNRCHPSWLELKLGASVV